MVTENPSNPSFMTLGLFFGTSFTYMIKAMTFSWIEHTNRLVVTDGAAIIQI